MHRSQHPTRRADVTVHELDGEALIYDPVSTNTHRLNGTALFIWRACDGCRDVDGIARRLGEVYEVSSEEALEQSTRLVAEFEETQLVSTTG